MRRARPQPVPPKQAPKPAPKQAPRPTSDITKPTGHPVMASSVSTGSLRVGGVPFRILPDAREGQVLVYRAGAWDPSDPAELGARAPPPSPVWAAEPADWEGPPPDLGEAVNRLASRLAQVSGPIP